MHILLESCAFNAGRLIAGLSEPFALKVCTLVIIKFFCEVLIYLFEWPDYFQKNFSQLLLTLIFLLIGKLLCILVKPVSLPFGLWAHRATKSLISCNVNI